MDRGRARRLSRGVPSAVRASALAALAERAGIVSEYVGQNGRQQTTDETRRALLAALDLDAHDERAAARSLARLDAASEELLPPTRVVRRGDRTSSLRARRPRELAGALHWTLEVRDEQGEVRRTECRAPARAETIDLPVPRLPAGYHRISLTLEAGGRSARAEQLRIVVPPRCTSPAERAAAGSFGLCVNLYSVASRRNWGIGDLGDLRRLLAWAGEIGAAFVGINPLHALRLRDGEVSPYSPDSRLFRSEIYLDVAAIPELGAAPALRRRLQSKRTRAALAAVRSNDRIDYDDVWRRKEPVLRELHRLFARGERERSSGRGRAYRAYVAEQGEALAAFATFQAIASRRGGDWQRWPSALRRPDSAKVARLRKEDSEEIDFHRWVQFELDRQLGVAARAADLPIGLYQDLAIGSSLAGSDAWAFPSSFVRAVHLGAPPDPFQEEGQDWSLPPLDPLGLARDGYRYWILLLRAAFRHAGALRIDHVMGLARQFWVPAGGSPAEGAYVRFPFEDLAGILALESQRAGAVVIGEDLGTVPDGFRKQLARWGILSSSVMLFERNRRGDFRAAGSYPRRALATANTHDLPPLRSFWEGHDIELRRKVGAIATDADLERERRQRERERSALARALERERLRPVGLSGAGDGRFRGAVHAFLARTPAALVGVSLDDLSGEREPVNLPGIDAERFPSWTRRMSVPLEKLRDDPTVEDALSALRRSRGSKPIGPRRRDRRMA
jgi:4-alpha-glucanotransferase